MGIFVYSTLTSGMEYANHHPDKDRIHPVNHESFRVTIKGGAGTRRAPNLSTPRGVRTEITAEQLVELRKNHTFNLHVKNGFIVIQEDATPNNANKVAREMNENDKSRPITPKNFVEDKDGKKKFVANGKD